MPKSSYAVHMRAYDHLAGAAAREAAELLHLKPLLETLNDSLEETRAARERQLALRAAAQQATRDFEAAFAKAGEAAARLRLGLRSAYGEKSMKLIAFGMRPHRAAWLPEKRQEVAVPPTPAAPPLHPGGADGTPPSHAAREPVAAAPDGGVTEPPPSAAAATSRRARHPAGGNATPASGAAAAPAAAADLDGGTVPPPGAGGRKS